MPPNQKTVNLALIGTIVAVIGIAAGAVYKFARLENRVDRLETGNPYAVAKLLPVGSIVAYWPKGIPPEGWLVCDGAAIPSNAMFDEIRRLIGPNVPDLRGMFLRGAGQNTDLRFRYPDDTARESGSPQEYGTAVPKPKDAKSSLKTKAGSFTFPGGPVALGGASTDLGYWWKRDHGELLYTQIELPELEVTGGDQETRPNNYAVQYIIRAF